MGNDTTKIIIASTTDSEHRHASELDNTVRDKTLAELKTRSMQKPGTLDNTEDTDVFSEIIRVFLSRDSVPRSATSKDPFGQKSVSRTKRKADRPRKIRSVSPSVPSTPRLKTFLGSALNLFVSMEHVYTI